MGISTQLESLRIQIEQVLDEILGERKAVCPDCGKVEHLFGETNIIVSHYIVPENPDFSNGIDFSVIKECPGSGKTVEII